MDKLVVPIPCCSEAQATQGIVQDFRRTLSEAAIYAYNNSANSAARFTAKAGAAVRREWHQDKGSKSKLNTSRDGARALDVLRLMERRNFDFLLTLMSLLPGKEAHRP